MLRLSKHSPGAVILTSNTLTCVGQIQGLTQASVCLWAVTLPITRVSKLAIGRTLDVPDAT